MCCFARLSVINSLLSNKLDVEIKVSLTGLSKFKEGVSQIQELLSLRKGTTFICKKLKWLIPRKLNGDHFWQWKQTIGLDSKGNHQWSGENGSNGRLKDKSYNFQGERNFVILVKLIVSKIFPQLSCNLSTSPVFYTSSLNNMDTDC